MVSFPISRDLKDEYLAAVHETTLGLISRLQVDDLLHAIVERAARLVGTEHGYVHLGGPDEEEMKVRVGVGFHGKYVGRRMRRGRGLAGRVWETGKPLVVENYGAWPHRLPDGGYDVLRSVVGVPLVSGSKVIGVLALSRLEPGDVFATEEVAILTRFAELASIAIDNARLHSALRQELTERKGAELDLKKSELHYRTLFEAAEDAILLIDGETVVDCNPSAERLFECGRREVIGSSIFDFCPERQRDGKPSRERGTEYVRRAVRGELHRFDFQHRAKSNRLFDAEVSINRFHGEAGSRLLVMVRDVSERKSLEEQLLHSQKTEAIGRLAGGIAHDLNNLLSGIMMMAELAKKRRDEGSSVEEDLEGILECGEHAASLIRHLLAFSRKQVLQPKTLDLNAVVEDMGRMLERLLGENVEMVAALDPEARPVRVDPAQIQQVIMNLAVNAKDAMPDGGTLTIETSNVDRRDGSVATPMVVLSVRDTGTGMDPETASRIFEPFYTTKESGKGTGLGLSTVHGIVSQSGGDVRVRRGCAS